MTSAEIQRAALKPQKTNGPSHVPAEPSWLPPKVDETLGKGRLSDEVDHPPHYVQGDIECIDAIEAAVVGKPADEAVCVANVIKYLWRYNFKGGLTSVEKARWYLDRLVEKLKSRYDDGTPKGFSP